MLVSSRLIILYVEKVWVIEFGQINFAPKRRVTTSFVPHFADQRGNCKVHNIEAHKYCYYYINWPKIIPDTGRCSWIAIIHFLLMLPANTLNVSHHHFNFLMNRQNANHKTLKRKSPCIWLHVLGINEARNLKILKKYLCFIQEIITIWYEWISLTNTISHPF